jgi:hypothetical protein
MPLRSNDIPVVPPMKRKRTKRETPPLHFSVSVFSISAFTSQLTISRLNRNSPIDASSSDFQTFDSLISHASPPQTIL